MFRPNRDTVSGFFLAGRYMFWLPVSISVFEFTYLLTMTFFPATEKVTRLYGHFHKNFFIHPVILCIAPGVKSLHATIMHGGEKV